MKMNRSVSEPYFVLRISRPPNIAQKWFFIQFAYGSQFSGEKIDLKIRYLAAEILRKKSSVIFLGHPLVCQYVLI